MSRRLLPHLIVAGLASAAFAAPAAGFFVGAFIAGPFGMLFGFVGGIGSVPDALLLAGLPAVLAGSLLWTMGRERVWARGRGLWAATGAAIGIAAAGLALLVPLEQALAPLDPPLTGAGPVLVGFAAAGAVSALLFRLQMHILLIFFPVGENRDTGGN